MSIRNKRFASSARAQIISFGQNGWNVRLEDGNMQLGIPSMVPSLRINQWVTLIRQGSEWLIVGLAVNAPNGIVPTE